MDALEIEGYEIDRVLGRGGFGVVFAAREVDSGESVAIKVMTPVGDGDDDNRATRFRREIVVVKQIEHPRVIRVLDYGELPKDVLWYAMELLDGEDLSERIAERGALSVGDAVEVASQILEALAAAHDHDVVHRDVKPANVFLRHHDAEEIDVVLLDFGIAVVPGAERLTQTGGIIGTPKYMAPESAQHAEYSPASDIYAVGIVLLEMMTGVPVFSGAPYEILVAHLVEEPEVPSELAETELGDWVVRALDKDAGSRFANAAAALDALREAAGETSDLLPVTLGGDEAAPATPSTPRGGEQVILTEDDRAALSRVASRGASVSAAEIEATVSHIVAVDAAAQSQLVDSLIGFRPTLDAVVSLEVPPPEGESADASAETQPLPEEEEPDWLVHGLGTQGEERASAESSIDEDVSLALDRASIEPAPERDPAPVDGSQPAGDEEAPSLPVAVRAAAGLILLLVVLFGLLAVVRGRAGGSNAPWGAPELARFRVESKPSGARVEVDGAYAGVTPTVVERAEEAFPLVLVFRHPNGATSSRIVDVPVRVVSVALPPPRTRPDTPPESHKPSDEVEVVAEAEDDQRGGRGGGGRSAEFSKELERLFGPNVPVNKELVLTAERQPTTPQAPVSTGTWWLNLRQRLTEMARECMPPERYAPSEDGKPPRSLLLELEVRLDGRGVIRRVETAEVERAPPPDDEVRECIEEDMIRRPVPRPLDREARDVTVIVNL